MLTSVHLVGDDEEDIYGGFNDYDPAFATENLEEDEAFQQALKTSHGQRPGVKTGKMTAVGARGKVPGSSMGRPTTGIAADTSQARPMTAVRSVGYSSSGSREISRKTLKEDVLSEAFGLGRRTKAFMLALKKLGRAEVTNGELVFTI